MAISKAQEQLKLRAQLLKSREKQQAAKTEIATVRAKLKQLSPKRRKA